MDRCAVYGASMLDCWARAGLPLAQPKVLFGAAAADPPGADDKRSELGGRRQIRKRDGTGSAGGDSAKAAPSDAEALVVTYLLNNDGWSSARAAAWEAKVALLLQSLAPAEGPTGGWKGELSVSYSVERAVEDEIARGEFVGLTGRSRSLCGSKCGGGLVRECGC